MEDDELSKMSDDEKQDDVIHGLEPPKPKNWPEPEE